MEALWLLDSGTRRVKIWLDKTNFQVALMFYTGATVDLAEGIIDDPRFFFSYFSIVFLP